MTDRNRKSSSRSNADFQDAAKRLEEAVSDLMSNAGNRVTESASKLLDDATNAIRNELSVNAARDDDSDEGQRRRRHQRWSSELGLSDDGLDPNWGLGLGDGSSGSGSKRPARGQGDALQRDPRNGKIAGVCAGIARYYGVEAWVVRCLAITGLLFMPQIVFPGYWIAYFVLGSAEGGSGRPRRRRRGGRRRRSRASAEEQGVEQTASERPEQPPRARLRNARGAFDDLEMRLRRMERHVTSGRYDLQRELGKIDDSAAPA